jgi:hypothetical protein
VKLTPTHWLLLEEAREAPLAREEDPEAIDALIASGLLREDAGSPAGSGYVPSEAGLRELERRSA